MVQLGFKSATVLIHYGSHVWTGLYTDSSRYGTTNSLKRIDIRVSQQSRSAQDANLDYPIGGKCDNESEPGFVDEKLVIKAPIIYGDDNNHSSPMDGTAEGNDPRLRE